MRRIIRKFGLVLMFMAIGVVFMIACSDDDTEPEITTVTDIDGNEYKTVKIGDQIWMAENLKTTTYRNGTAISNVTSCTSWRNLSTEAYAWYSNSVNWKDHYGALYNWYAVNDPRGLCPEGWSVPSDDDWTQLVDYVVAQGFPNEWDNPNGAGNALKSCRQFGSPIEGCNVSEHPRWYSIWNSTHHGFDEFGFSALPGGLRSPHNGGIYDIGSFFYLGDYAVWWSATEASSTTARSRSIDINGGHVFRGSPNKSFGYSLRCVREIMP